MTNSLKKIAWSVFETANSFEFGELTCSDFPFEGALLGGIESLKEEYVLALENCPIIRAILAQMIVEELTTGSVHESWIQAMAAEFNEKTVEKPLKSFEDLLRHMGREVGRKKGEVSQEKVERKTPESEK